MIMGLDVSTSCIGVCVLDGKELVHADYIVPDDGDIFEKIEFSFEKLCVALEKYKKIDTIFVEEPLININQKSSIDVIKKLIRFNFALLNNIYIHYKIKSIYVPASSAKKILGIKKLALVDNELVQLVDVKLDKRLGFQYCLNTFKNFKSFVDKPVNKFSKGKFKGLMRDTCFDVTDSIVIACAGPLYRP